MKTTLLTDLTIKDINGGFVWSSVEEKGLFGWGGKLTIQPEYQRHYIYGDNNNKQAIAVVESILKNYPIGLIYFVKTDEDKYEVLDGQQRITSFCRFIEGKFSITQNNNPQTFTSLAIDLQQRIMNYPLTIYICEGSEAEIKEWFKTINIAGEPLNKQELRNALYSGPFVTNAKAVFSYSGNNNLPKWETFVKKNIKRQEYLEVALDWVSNGNIETYMSEHRYNEDISELKNYFDSVIDWAAKNFTDNRKELLQQDWGYLFKTYHNNSYNVIEINERINELFADFFVKNKKGIYEYVLDNEQDTSLLNVRVFDPPTIRTIYEKQTNEAKQKKISNCPLCAISDNNNKDRIYKLEEMDADHVTAWSKEGHTDISNCEMLCKTHNRAKGNK